MLPKLLELTDEELQWGFYMVNQEALTNLGARYALHELFQISPPYMKTRHNLETITKSFNNYLSKAKEASKKTWDDGSKPQ